ncbi:uncharacterized protein BXZ73DRAFT_44270 [Epithele typhae]|uniref:uncharacterized protein n=1 Tax=Epithele typhae TaxID=378194 RepID=UPI0020073895|nr:uncharacterized protein BXZ73DRAFT_44270 [Epithele typhae]KAH9939064.1 hypothetical protein BXZ73DRAFT_44270 [Epithele typhae]
MTLSAARATLPIILQYFRETDDGAPPFINATDDEAHCDTKRANWRFEMRFVAIEDARGSEHAYSLDVHGFQFAYRPARHTRFDDDADIAREYYPEMADFVKSVTGAVGVVVFDHTIRCRDPHGHVSPTIHPRQPVYQVHVDQTPKSAVIRLRTALPHLADQLMKRRFQILNLWRPIENAAVDWPLALCDARTVDVAKELVPVRMVCPEGRAGETFSVRHGKGHRWHFLRGMTPEECVIFKCFDSIDDGSVARFTPHSAFADPTAPDDAPYRQSIELRVLVFYDR